jgi:hypothetical protein
LFYVASVTGVKPELAAMAEFMEYGNSLDRAAPAARKSCKSSQMEFATQQFPALGDKECGAFDHHGAGAGGSSYLPFLSDSIAGLYWLDCVLFRRHSLRQSP